MRYASLIVAGALAGEVILVTYISRLCNELPSSSMRLCQWETIRPEGIHTHSATAAGKGMMLHSPRMYAGASGVGVPTLFPMLMSHGLRIAGFKRADKVIELQLDYGEIARGEASSETLGEGTGVSASTLTDI